MLVLMNHKQFFAHAPVAQSFRNLWFALIENLCHSSITLERPLN